MKLLIKLLPDLVGQTEYVPHQSRYGNPILGIMLLDHDKPMNYEEAMMSPDSTKWFEAMKSVLGNAVISKKFLRSHKIYLGDA